MKYLELAVGLSVLLVIGLGIWGIATYMYG